MKSKIWLVFAIITFFQTYCRADGSGDLGNIFKMSKCGLNYAQASKKVTNRTPYGGSGSGLPCVLNINTISTSSTSKISRKLVLQ